MRPFCDPGRCACWQEGPKGSVMHLSEVHRWRLRLKQACEAHRAPACARRPPPGTPHPQRLFRCRRCLGHRLGAWRRSRQWARLVGPLLRPDPGRHQPITTRVPGGGGLVVPGAVCNEWASRARPGRGDPAADRSQHARPAAAKQGTGTRVRATARAAAPTNGGVGRPRVFGPA